MADRVGRDVVDQGPFTLLNGTSSTAEGEALVLPYPMSQFGFEVVTGSSDAIVTLNGSVASSSDSAKAVLLTIDMSSDGVTGVPQFVTGSPVSMLTATLTSGASSGGATARVVAAP
jgi:hypothetical protein